VVVRAGDAGDRFYIVDSGELEIVNGAHGIARHGDFFGEIALLRDVPRTATVRAIEPLRLYAIARDDFVGAVTGHAPTLAAAELVMAGRLPAGALS
jgi:CRP-like cAMP-binding protein